MTCFVFFPSTFKFIKYNLLIFTIISSSLQLFSAKKELLNLRSFDLKNKTISGYYLFPITDNHRVLIDSHGMLKLYHLEKKKYLWETGFGNSAPRSLSKEIGGVSIKNQKCISKFKVEKKNEKNIIVSCIFDHQYSNSQSMALGIKYRFQKNRIQYTIVVTALKTRHKNINSPYFHLKFSGMTKDKNTHKFKSEHAKSRLIIYPIKKKKKLQFKITDIYSKLYSTKYPGIFLKRIQYLKWSEYLKHFEHIPLSKGTLNLLYSSSDMVFQKSVHHHYQLKSRFKKKGAKLSYRGMLIIKD